MLIGDGSGGGGRWINRNIPARCNWIHFYCRRNVFGAYNHHRRRRQQKHTQARCRSVVAVCVPYRVAAALYSKLDNHMKNCMWRRQFSHSITIFRALRRSFVRSFSCTHQLHRPLWPRADFVSSAVHCYFNLLQKEQSSGTTTSPSATISCIALSHFFPCFFAPFTFQNKNISLEYVTQDANN